jgi:hypothetical protein
MSNERCSRAPGFALLLGAIVALSACGGPTAPSSDPSPTPSPTAVQTVVMQASIDSLPVDYVAGQYFSTSAAGTLDVTVDWTFTEDTLYVWLAKGQCTFEQFGSDACEYLTQSLAPRPKPGVLSVPGLAAGPYTLIVGNLGPRDESVSYQVVLTSTGAVRRTNAASGESRGFLQAWRHR